MTLHLKSFLPMLSIFALLLIVAYPVPSSAVNHSPANSQLASIPEVLSGDMGGGSSTPYYFQYNVPYTMYDSVSAVVRIISESGKQWDGVGSFQISMDDKVAGTLTSGQTGTGKLYAGTCYEQYIGESTTGYVVKTGESCQNVKREHKVEVGAPSGSSSAEEDKPCPSAVCVYDPDTKDIRFYLVSDKTQYKGNGETAEFDFKIEYRWGFSTVDQNGSPIDLTSNGFGFFKSDGTGPLASGSELLKEGTTVTVGYTDAPAAETSPRNTRYAYDHVMVLEGDVGKNMGSVANVIMDSPKTTMTYWQKQYYLSVNSRCETSSGSTFTCGNPQGEGYYNEGSQATYSVDQRARDPGWMGTFGGFYLFDQWTGDSASRSSSDTITMDSSKQVTATYTYNDRDAIRNIMILVAIGFVPPGVLVWVIIRRRGRRPPPPPPMFPQGPYTQPGMGGYPPGYQPGMMGSGQAGPSSGGPGFQAGPTPTTTGPPKPPGLGSTPGSTPGSSAGHPGSGAPGSGAAGLGHAGSAAPGSGAPSSGVQHPGSGVGHPGSGGPGSGGPTVSGSAGSTGSGGSSGGGASIDVPEHPTGSGMGRTAAGVGLAAAATGAVVLARKRKGNKCVWCESKIKGDEAICRRCKVHQECTTCGTPLYKASLISKGYSANPGDEGLFCDTCKVFTR